MVNQDDARRVQNKHNAMLLARNGIPVFPSSGKVPLVKLYNRRDTEIKPEDREAAIEQAREEGNKQLTVFVGATTDPDIVKRMWRHPNQDAVPSVACGPARLVVIDADTKFNGPELIGKLFDEHGGVPEGTQIITTQSGGRHYIFSDPDNAFTNSAGALKKQYGCDVRGRGGQFVAPGSLREDGKRYGDQAALKAFIEAYTNGTIPPLPDYIVELIGTSSAEVGEDIPISKEREIIKQIDEADIPEWEELCAPLGEYDFDKLQAENSEFKSLYNEPGDDCSDNRFKAARHVMREWPQMPPEHLASFFLAFEGAGEFVDSKPRSGEYDNRQTAREWLKNQGLSKASTGEAFGAVVDDDEDSEYEREVAAEKEAEKAAKPKGTLRRMSGVAIYADPNWMVENICTRGMVGMLHAPSNAGKTFSAFHMGGKLSEGWEWFGRNVEQCGVLYCVGEGHGGINRRALAWSNRYKPKHDALIFRDGVPNFALDPKGARRALRKAVKEANAMLEGEGLSVGLLFLDTFAKAVAGAEESSAREMQPILDMLRELAVELDICIIIVHHSGKDTSLGARGSSAIFADVDFNLEIVNADQAKKKHGLSLKHKSHSAIIMPKMRDSGKSGRFEFKLEEVELGKNKWGNPVTSMVVVEVEDKPSEGSAFGVVDEEAPTTKDELTPEVNRSDDNSRLRLCAKIIKAVQKIGKLVGKEVHADAELVRLEVKAMQDIYDEAGPDNYARAFKRRVFGGDEVKRFVPEANGSLHYVTQRGKPSMLVFKPRS